MRRSVVLVLVLVVVLSACRIDTSVTVRVRDDGSGLVTARVRLDADAVEAAESGGAKLEAAVRLDDLSEAGWRTSGWKRRKDGGATLTVTKGFARAGDAGAVVAELSGADGPVRDVRVTRDASTFQQEWSFSGIGDLKDLKTGIATDADLVARLGAQRVDVAALDQRLLAQTRDALRVRVVADLPHASDRVFPVPAGTAVVMHTSSSETATTRLAALVVGVAFAITAIGLLAIGGLRARRRGLRSARRTVDT